MFNFRKSFRLILFYLMIGFRVPAVFDVQKKYCIFAFFPYFSKQRITKDPQVYKAENIHRGQRCAKDEGARRRRRVWSSAHLVFLSVTAVAFARVIVIRYKGCKVKIKINSRTV